METNIITGIIALAGLLFSVASFSSKWSAMQRLKQANDLSIPKDSAARGVFYAFTIGMTPWAKESTRLHAAAYVRGVLFHIGVFLGIAALFVSPWYLELDVFIREIGALIIGVGALTGIAGGIMRMAEKNLRTISTPDDHFSVWIVSVALTIETLALLKPEYVPFMHIVFLVLFVFAPMSKIRHCVYFYYGRLFFGLHIGRRGIVRGLEASHG